MGRPDVTTALSCRPSRGYENCGGSGLHGCRNKAVKALENLCSQTTRFKRNQDPRSGENKYKNYQWHPSCYGTDNKDFKFEESACLSETSQVQRNLLRQNTPTGKIRNI